jgi:hypothetical protein
MRHTSCTVHRAQCIVPVQGASCTLHRAKYHTQSYVIDAVVAPSTSTMHAARCTMHGLYSRPRLLVDIPRERLDVLERSHRQNPMTKIENVTGPASRSGQYIVSSA